MKITPPSGDAHEWICRRNTYPGGGKGFQLPLGIREIDPVFAPGLAVIEQLEMLTEEWMKRMGYLEGLFRTVR